MATLDITFVDLIDEFYAQVPNPLKNFYELDDVKSWLNKGILVSCIRSLLNRGTADVNSIKDTNKHSFADKGILKIFRITYDGDLNKLIPKTWDEIEAMKEEIAVSTSDNPLYVVVEGTDAYVFPAPAVTGKIIRFHAALKPEILVNDADKLPETLINHFEAPIDYAMIRALIKAKDFAAAKEQRDVFSLDIAEMRKDAVPRIRGAKRVISSEEIT